MIRFRLLLLSEVRLFRTAIPIHMVVIVQPTIMFLLMGIVLISPTFDMHVARPVSVEGHALVAVMDEIGSPVGLPYIRPVLVDSGDGAVYRQVISVEERDGVPTAVQRFGLIDSNMVKNFRNRLTAAALLLWNQELDGYAVTIREHPWLPRDVPYTIYFGMAMLPMSAALAASAIGGILTAQEFEFRTILEFRLAPISPVLIVAARLARLVLTSLISVTALLIAIGLVTGAWPTPLWQAALALIPVALIAGCLGVIAGLLFQRTIPAFLVGLVTSFVGWLLGSAFGLAAGFGRTYEFLSRLTPNTHAVELLFRSYYDLQPGQWLVSVLTLAVMVAVMLTLTVIVYRWRVLGRARV
jgi:ABC-type multidrug transport system permease subunit